MRKLLITIIILTSHTIIGQTLETYPLDIQKSVLNWKGTYVFNFSEHHGTVEFKKGFLQVVNDKITGGTFIIDMKSITNEDHKVDKNHGPVEHLKNSDFFDVQKYPEAQLEIINVVYNYEVNEHRFKADLTIKGITHPIEFRAVIDGFNKVMTTSFKIDRTLWGITYNHKLKNDAISDAIEFEAELYF